MKDCVASQLTSELRHCAAIGETIGKDCMYEDFWGVILKIQYFIA